MGKGNRSRIERAMADSNNTTQYAKANKKKVSGAGIFVGIAAILVVIALLTGCISMVVENGLISRMLPVVDTENYHVTGTMMNYFYTTQFNNYYQYYNQMYSQFASSGLDVSTYVYQAMGIKDPGKSLKQQEYTGTTENGEKVTVFEYYMGLTEDYVTRLLTYCEYGLANDIVLSDDELEEIDHSLEHMKEEYKSYKKNYDNNKELYMYMGYPYYRSYSAYLAGSYGQGVNERDIRECMKLTKLASKVEESLTDEMRKELEDDNTNAALEEYVKNNPASFLMADYYSYTFTTNNKGKTTEEFEAETQELLAKAEALSKLEGKEAYKEAVLELLKEAEKKTFRSKNLTKYLKDYGSAEEAEAKLNEAFEKEWETIKETKYEATLKTEYKYSTTHSDLSTWIFGFEKDDCTDDCTHEGAKKEDGAPAKEGDITHIVTETTKQENAPSTTTKGTTAATTEEVTTEEVTTDAAAPAAETTKAEETTTGSSGGTNGKIDVTTYTVTVYMLDKAAYRDTEITKHFGYVMFKDKAQAEKYHAELSKKEDKTLDAMVDVLNDLHEEISVYDYSVAENYVPGTLKDQKTEGADEWLEKAAKGSMSDVVELVKTTSTTKDGKTTETKTTYYAVLLYENATDYEAWYYTALTGAVSEDLTEWMDENKLDQDELFGDKNKFFREFAYSMLSA